jgi:hypothetical protein
MGQPIIGPGDPADSNAVHAVILPRSLGSMLFRRHRHLPLVCLDDIYQASRVIHHLPHFPSGMRDYLYGVSTISRYSNFGRSMGYWGYSVRYCLLRNRMRLVVRVQCQDLRRCVPLHRWGILLHAVHVVHCHVSGTESDMTQPC